MANSRDDDDDLLDQVNALADRYGLKGSERRKFIHGHMTRGGYRAEPTYVRDAQDDDDDDDDEFFTRRRRPNRDDDGRGNRSQRRSSSGDSWYE